MDGITARLKNRAGHNVYFNPYNVKSYVLSMVRPQGYGISDEEARGILTGKRAPRHYHQHYLDGMKPGAFWLHVEINKADRDGRKEDSALHHAALDGHINVMLRQT